MKLTVMELSPQFSIYVDVYLKARLTIIEETPVPGHEDHQGSVLGLVLAPLDLSLQVATALQ